MKGKKRAEKLTPRLKELYTTHIKLERQLGAPPSVRELVAALKLSNNYISRVHGDLDTLVEIGLLTRLPIPTRRFKAVGPPPNKVNWEKLLNS